MELSQDQIEIVETKGNLIVRASAGAGKTSVMIKKIEKEIEDNRSHKVVAVITFTHSVEKEIKSRLKIDYFQHYVGTTDGFALKEVIEPFIKDVIGKCEFKVKADYTKDINSFEEGLNKIKKKGIISSYVKNIKKNFLFQLAKFIVERSKACQLYLKSRYFKIYIDEYQDCDFEMHKFFMYLCDNLKLEMFIIGDEKQSIFQWRGAYPGLFKNINGKNNFTQKLMCNNYRCCKQIQNYSNLLFQENSRLCNNIENNGSIILINKGKLDELSLCKKVIDHIDLEKSVALIRSKNEYCKSNASYFSELGAEFVYIPKILNSITSNEIKFLYISIFKYIAFETYSEYDLKEEMMSYCQIKTEFQELKKILINIKNTVKERQKFQKHVIELSRCLGYDTENKYFNDCFDELYKIVSEKDDYIPAVEMNKYKHIAITAHSSKGLEFDQVIVFLEDYKKNNVGVANEYINLYYVAVTRAKSKLIIVDNGGENDIKNILEENINKHNLSMKDLLMEL